jgi:hypothetical protein
MKRVVMHGALSGGGLMIASPTAVLTIPNAKSSSTRRTSGSRTSAIGEEA